MILIFGGGYFSVKEKRSNLLVASEKVDLEVSRLTICSCLVNKMRVKMTT